MMQRIHRETAGTTETHTHAHNRFMALDFVRGNTGELVPEETFAHSHLTWSSD